MKFMKQTCGEFHKVYIKMATCVRFCFKMGFYPFKMTIILIRTHFVDMVVVNDITFIGQKYYYVWSYYS